MPAFIQRDVFQLRELPAILSDVVSAAWRGGDRRPDGAEAPPPPGRSSRVRDSGRATPYAVRQGGRGRGRPAEKSFPSERAVADGVGGCRGQGAGKPLPPAPRREATIPGGRAEAAAQGRPTACNLMRRCASRAACCAAIPLPVRPCEEAPEGQAPAPCPRRASGGGQTVAFAPFRPF